MELQFEKVQCSCLQQLKWELQTQEETQEVRLPDDMPDIGNILGAWGQVLLRGKEWRSGSAQISGGVMTWVFYLPEEGNVPCCVEAWLPFQIRYELPDTRYDGKLNAMCAIRSVDARSTSARKMMIRATVETLLQAVVPDETVVFTPSQLPEDVKVLKTNRKIRLPKEAGEKPFSLEEELTLPGSCPNVKKILRYSLHPELIDRKVMADKVVFRGTALLHAVYLSQEDTLCSWDFEIPFSQYAQLEDEYGQEAQAQLHCAVTALELEMDSEGRLLLKAGMTGQYAISDEMQIETVEDTYSNRRTIRQQTQQLMLPQMLEDQTQTIHAEQSVSLDGGRIVDAAFYPSQPVLQRTGESVQLLLPGQFQVLYYDENEMLRCSTVRWEDHLNLPTQDDVEICSCVDMSGYPQATIQPGVGSVRCDLSVQVQSLREHSLCAVSGVELEDVEEPNPQRPSLILCRKGSTSLWQLAKKCGSDPDMILQANGLTEEPSPEQMLLIPVE